MRKLAPRLKPPSCLWLITSEMQGCTQLRARSLPLDPTDRTWNCFFIHFFPFKSWESVLQDKKLWPRIAYLGWVGLDWPNIQSLLIGFRNLGQIRCIHIKGQGQVRKPHSSVTPHLLLLCSNVESKENVYGSLGYEEEKNPKVPLCEFLVYKQVLRDFSSVDIAIYPNCVISEEMHFMAHE